MIDLSLFEGSTFAVLGLGKSGLATARALKAGGATAWVWDDSAKTREDARQSGFDLVDLTSCDWSAVKALVLSPGIPHTHPAPHPVAVAARAAGKPIIGDIELLARAEPDASFIGITGTNGKSTTTALVGHILKACGKPVEVGGNLGTAALTLAPLGVGGTYLLEMSSYQTELTQTLGFNVAALLNITPDHLERHGGLDGYIAAKRRIFSNPTLSSVAVVGIDDLPSRSMADALVRDGRRVIRISNSQVPAKGVYVQDGVLIDAIDGNPRAVIEMRKLVSLPGLHNAQNAAAAYAITRSAGLEPMQIAHAMQSFPGLAHRQERIATIEGILFVNDSKATNADAARWALGCYDNIYWIAGGVPKDGGIASLAEFMPRVRKAYLIGQAAGEFAGTIGSAAPYDIAETMDEAVRLAFADAQASSRPNPVVLLSPAAASFDQYPNFEVRGDHFRRLTLELTGGHGK
jgi:UDP-N-acetylmuramoylalanine--D-glutamate ligase